MRVRPSRRRRAASRPVERRGGWRFLRLLLAVVLLAWLIRSFIAAPFSIPSGSMLPKLRIGDYILVAKWPYGYSRASFPFGTPSFDGRRLADLPERGDIVVFRGPDGETDLVKRVIGLPGDTVALQGGMLILNGEPIPRKFEEMVAIPVSPNSPCRVVAGATPRLARYGGACLYPAYRETLPGGASYVVIDQVDTARADEMPSVRVPEGQLFLMGDNRDDSLDSRFAPSEGGVGMVALENLIGRAGIVFWSTDGSADYWKPWTWFSALRVDRLGETFGAEER